MLKGTPSFASLAAHYSRRPMRARTLTLNPALPSNPKPNPNPLHIPHHNPHHNPHPNPNPNPDPNP